MGFKEKTAAVIREYILITLGAIAMGAGVYFFKIPNTPNVAASVHLKVFMI